MQHYATNYQRVYIYIHINYIILYITSVRLVPEILWAATLRSIFQAPAAPAGGATITPEAMAQLQATAGRCPKHFKHCLWPVWLWMLRQMIDFVQFFVQFVCFRFGSLEKHSAVQLPFSSCSWPFIASISRDLSIGERKDPRKAPAIGPISLARPRYNKWA